MRALSSVHQPTTRADSQVLTELLYCTSMRMRCERCLDNFCMILAKLIVEKKLRHEKSVKRSTSSSCFCPFGRMVVRTIVCRDGRCMCSSTPPDSDRRANRVWQYRKKLRGRVMSAGESQ